MKYQKNGIICDTDKDNPLCGTMCKEGEITLYKTNRGQFYTHVIELNKKDKVSGQKIELNTPEDAALIMTEFGFSKDTIREETGYKVINNISKANSQWSASNI